MITKNDFLWPLCRPLLQNTTAFKPTPELIRMSHLHFCAMLRVRYSTPLLRMASVSHISRQLRFHNTGPGQVPGVVVMELVSTERAEDDGVFDPRFRRLLVVVSAKPLDVHEHSYPEGCLKLSLHPELAEYAQQDALMQQCAADDARRLVHVPGGRVVAVFVEHREA